MVKEFLNPNWHVVLIHYPLGLLVLGFVIELFSFLWRRSSFRTAGRWMILLGALSCVPATLSGVYALADVARMHNPAGEGATWEETAAEAPLNDPQWEMLEDHIWLESAATLLAVLAVVAWLACSDFWRMRLHWVLMVVIAVSVGLMSAGAWHAGETIFLHGTAVELRSEEPSAEEQDGEAGESSAAELETEAKPFVERYVPPLQAHATLAGIAAALALAALGLSIRAITSVNATEPAPSLSTAADGGSSAGYAAAIARSLNPEGERTPDEPRVPSARFWLLAALLTLLTAATGLWVLASGMETWKPAELWRMINDWEEARRRLLHVIAGVSILVLTLLLAAAARWAPRSKLLLSILAVLLVFALTVQVWLGVLLLYDSSSGPLTKFNSTADAGAP